MGTRADFYSQSGKQLQQKDWIGSIAWDGYPRGIPAQIKKAKTEKEFIKECKKFFKNREDVSLPKDGWPWPWNDSSTTDYAYVFYKGNVSWRPRIYPDMTKIKKVAIGSNKSGLIIFVKR